MTKALNVGQPAQGEHVHLASRGARAPSGVVEVVAEAAEGARKIYDSLRGQVALAGPGYLAIEFKNDFAAPE